MSIQRVHENNYRLLLANDWIVDNYINTAYNTCLYAHHADGRVIKIAV